MASRSLEDLEPAVKELAITFVKKCADVGIDVLIYCTWRSHTEQDELYAQGRTKPGKRVTDAKGGQSWHNYKRAFDFVPLVNGKAAWNDTKLYNTCGTIGEGIGLEWAGRWTGSLKETAHMQYRGGKTLADMQKEK